MNKNRLYFFDNLKFILITLVVIGHFLMFSSKDDYAMGNFLFIYSFHMPLFVFVTGFFAKRIISADGNRRLNKIISFFIIYLIYKLFIFLICNYVYNVEYVFNFFTESEAPWYLLGCIIWIMITVIFTEVKPKYLFIFSFICFLFISYDNNIVDQFCLSRVLIFYPFYLLGYYITPEQINKIVDILHNKKRYLLLSIVFLTGVYFIFVYCAKDLYFLRPFFTARNPFAYIDFPFDILCTGAFFRAFWFLYLILLGLAIFTIIPNKKTSYSEFGSRTLQVYVLHFIVVLIVMYGSTFSFLVKLFGNHVYAVLIIIGFVTSLVLSLRVFEKPFAKILKLDFSKLYK